MLHNQKYIFLYALLLTIVVFNLGIFMGYMLESSRVDKIDTMYLNAEVELLDQMIQRDALNVLDLDCSLLVRENIKFGDNIFQESLQIQKYEDANRINNEIIFQHKRFDALRALFWVNSMTIRQKCNSQYHNLVYLYQYNEPTLEQESKQKFFSNVLKEIKEKEGDNVMLIPLAGDNELSSVELLKEKYGITELPIILIDEITKLTDIESMEDIEKYLI